MLVIRRRAGESIHIGDNIEVEVIECGPQRVKLGISAPREVAVMRNEVIPTRDQNVAAARSIALVLPSAPYDDMSDAPGNLEDRTKASGALLR